MGFINIFHPLYHFVSKFYTLLIEPQSITFYDDQKSNPPGRSISPVKLATGLHQNADTTAKMVQETLSEVLSETVRHGTSEVNSLGWKEPSMRDSEKILLDIAEQEVQVLRENAENDEPNPLARLIRAMTDTQVAD